MPTGPKGQRRPAAHAQGRVEVGCLSYGEHSDNNLSVFLSGLRRLGWREETNLTFVPRLTQSLADLAASAHELLSRDLSVLVTVGLAATRIAKNNTTRLPIVFGAVLSGGHEQGVPHGVLRGRLCRLRAERQPHPAVGPEVETRPS
jgi:hypothetical protein